MSHHPKLALEPFTSVQGKLREGMLNNEMSIKVEYHPPLSPRRRGDEMGGMVGIECAFCGGEGIDPFDILSPLSLCPVCGGRKVVQLEEPIKKCAFCDGAGVHPHTRLTCTVCMGKGAQTVKEPVVVCPKCHGSGASIHGSNLPCIICHGSGVVPANEE